MSNLGLYQKIVVWAKTVGGPAKLIALIALGGYALFRGAEAVIKKIISYIQNRNEKNSTFAFRNTAPILINKPYSDPNISLSLMPGDKYNIIAIDGDAAIIEKIGDNNNPYVISLSILRSISYQINF